jgi:polyhydroxyalkanoate synthesis regulator phasin
LRRKIISLFIILAILAITIIPLASCNSSEPTTGDNPLVELQDEVSALSTNFNTEITNIKSRLTVLEGSSSSAFSSRIVALENDVAALKQQSGNTGTSEVTAQDLQNVADEVLATNSSLDALREEVNTISTDVDTLKQSMSQIQIVDYSDALEELAIL